MSLPVTFILCFACIYYIQILESNATNNLPLMYHKFLVISVSYKIRVFHIFWQKIVKQYRTLLYLIFISMY